VVRCLIFKVIHTLHAHNKKLFTISMDSQYEIIRERDDMKCSTMDTAEMYEILQTCIIGSASSACGLSYGPDDCLEVYHLDDVLDKLEDGVTGDYNTPYQYLESMCGTNSKRIVETIYRMEESWKMGTNMFYKTWQIPIGNALWKIGCDPALGYISEMFEDSDAEDFIHTGNFLFGNFTL
jgi:hypothetical protein